MAVASDLYVPGQSWAHQVNPRVKLLFVACSLVLLLVLDNFPVLLAALVLVHWLHWSARIPATKLLFVWRTLLPVGILICTLWTVFYPEGESLFEVGIVRVTAMAILRGLVVALRILTMAFVVFAWLYTTPQSALVRSFVKLRMPYEWGLVLALALRYIPTFRGTYTLIAEAQQARGLELRGSGFKRVRAMMPILVAMIISSLRASEHLARALEARGVGGARGGHRTMLHDIVFRPLDYGLVVLLVAATTVLLYVNLRHGVGEHPLQLT